MALTPEKINDIKFSVDVVNGSLKIYGNPEISDSLLKHNLNHLLKAAAIIAAELNEREVLNKKIES